MGVKWLFLIKNELDEIHKKIETKLHAQRKYKWAITCAVLLNARGKDIQLPDVIAKELYVLTFDGDTRKYLVIKDLSLAADEGMLAVLEKVKFNLPRAVIQVQGWQYDVGDFSVRTGSIMLNNSARGERLMEVEYRPCVNPNNSIDLLNEFLAQLSPTEAGKTALVAAPLEFSANSGLPANYGPQHTALQYVRLFGDLGFIDRRVPS